MAEEKFEQIAPTIPGFGGAIKTCFQKYCDFKGRASRSEYWYFFLFTHAIELVLGGLAFACLFPAFASKIVSDNSEQFFDVQDAAVVETIDPAETDALPAQEAATEDAADENAEEAAKSNKSELTMPDGQVVEAEVEKTQVTQEELDETLNVLNKVSVGGTIIGLACLGLLTLFELIVLLPNIGLAVRRLHDVNLTGWLLLLALTQVGALALLVIYMIPPTKGANKYGLEPVKQ